VSNLNEETACALRIEAEIRALAPGVIASLRPLDAAVSFDFLGVPHLYRGRGVARRAITLACDQADASGVPIVMQPDAGFGSDLRRLVSWYGSHGFSVVAGALPFTMRREPTLPRMTPVLLTQDGDH
jgi:hypothetical protein